MPSRYLGMDPKEVDPEAERAFLLACAFKTIEAEKEQARKLKSKK